MTIPLWREESIASHHDRKAFDCGDESLNKFLRRHARQSHDKGAARTFLAVSDTTPSILGYYTLSIATVAYALTPETIKRGLSHQSVPMFRLCKLAVAQTYKGQGLGGQLLLAAGRRCLQASTQVGGVAMLIDAKNEKVASWYASYGALQFPVKPLTLAMPFYMIRKAFADAEKV